MILEFEEHQKHIEILTNRILKRVPSHLISREDFIQEGWLGACQAAQSFRDGQGSQFRTWVEFRARGAVFDALRRNHLVKKIRMDRSEPPEIVCSDNLLNLKADSVPSPFDQAAANEISQMVNNALRKIPPREEAILRGLFIEGRTEREIGSSLGISEGRVSQLKMAGMRRLQKLLRRCVKKPLPIAQKRPLGRFATEDDA